jgi:hypothetical protein
MKVDSSTGPRGTAATRRGDRVGSGRGNGDFARQLDEASSSPATGGVAASAGITGVLGLIGVQESDDALAGKRHAIARAETMLDRLDELRHGLLMGELNRNQLEDLGRLVRIRRGQVDDPTLLGVLDEIDLRAQVELAKLESRL